MPPLVLRFAQVLMLLVLFAAAGGHWMALQSFAWTRMLISYSQQGQFAEAMAKTFDGKHPCSLCKEIAQEKSKEKSSDRAVSVDHIAAFVAPAVVTVVRSEGITWMLEIPQQESELRAEQPLSPPPRGAQA
jgi:hypothetical protein